MPTANYKYLYCFKAIFEYKLKSNIFYIWQRKEVERRREGQRRKNQLSQTNMLV